MFGRQQNEMGTFVKFQPCLGMDTGVHGITTVRFQCISLMKEYEDKSLEELRLEDYGGRRRAFVCSTCKRPFRNDPFGFTISKNSNSSACCFDSDKSKSIKWPQDPKWPCQATNWPPQASSWTSQAPIWHSQAPSWPSQYFKPMPVPQNFLFKTGVPETSATCSSFVTSKVSQNENTKTFEKIRASFNGKMKSSLTDLLEQFYLDLSDDVKKVVRLEVQSEIEKLRNDFISVLDFEIRKFKDEFTRKPKQYKDTDSAKADTLPNEKFEMATIKDEIISLLESEMNKFMKEFNSTLMTLTVQNMSTSNMEINDSYQEESSNSKNFNHNAVGCLIKEDLPSESNTDSEKIEQLTSTDQSLGLQSSQSKVASADDIFENNESELEYRISKMNSQIVASKRKDSEEISLNSENLRSEVKSDAEKVEQVSTLKKNTSAKLMLQSEDVEKAKRVNLESSKSKTKCDAKNVDNITKIESLKEKASKKVMLQSENVSDNTQVGSLKEDTLKIVMPQSENAQETSNTESSNFEKTQSESNSDTEMLESFEVLGIASKAGETNVFGSTSNPSAIRIGLTGSSELFGQSQSRNAGGGELSSTTGGTGVLGSTSNPSTALFGQPQSSTAGGGGLSSIIVGTGAFGSTSTPTGTTTALFGQPKATTADTGRLFSASGGCGVLGSSTAPSTGLFGQPHTTTAGSGGLSSTFGGTGGFGSTSTRSTGLFGQLQSKTADDRGLSSASGESGVLGTSAAPSTGLFGQPHTTTAGSGGLSSTFVPTGETHVFGSTSNPSAIRIGLAGSSGLFDQSQSKNAGGGELSSTTGGTGAFGSTSTRSTGLFGQPQSKTADGRGLSSASGGCGALGSSTAPSTGLFGQPHTTTAGSGGLSSTFGFGNPSSKKNTKGFNCSFFSAKPSVSINFSKTTSNTFGNVKAPTTTISFGFSPSFLTAKSASSTLISSTTTTSSSAITTSALPQVTSYTKEAVGSRSNSTLEKIGKLLDEKLKPLHNSVETQRLDLDEVKKCVLLELNSKTDKLDDIRSDIENLKDKITSVFKSLDSEYRISKVNRDVAEHEFTCTTLVLNYANAKQTLLQFESDIAKLVKREQFKNNNLKENSEGELYWTNFIPIVKSIWEHEVENLVLALQFGVVSLKFQTERFKKELIDILLLVVLESENIITRENVFVLFVYLIRRDENDFCIALKSVLFKFEILEKEYFRAVEKKNSFVDIVEKEKLKHIFNVIIKTLKPKIEDLEVEFVQIVEPLKNEAENIRN